MLIHTREDSRAIGHVLLDILRADGEHVEQLDKCADKGAFQLVVEHRKCLQVIIEATKDASEPRQKLLERIVLVANLVECLGKCELGAGENDGAEMQLTDVRLERPRRPRRSPCRRLLRSARR